MKRLLKRGLFPKDFHLDGSDRQKNRHMLNTLSGTSKWCLGKRRRNTALTGLGCIRKGFAGRETN